jgi:hypothetical protein
MDIQPVSAEKKFKSERDETKVPFDLTYFRFFYSIKGEARPNIFLRSS